METFNYDTICDNHEHGSGEKYSIQNLEQWLYTSDQEKSIKSEVNFYIFHDPVGDYLEYMRKIDIRPFMLKECWFLVHHKLHFSMHWIILVFQSRSKVQSINSLSGYDSHFILHD